MNKKREITETSWVLGVRVSQSSESVGSENWIKLKWFIWDSKMWYFDLQNWNSVFNSISGGVD